MKRFAIGILFAACVPAPPRTNLVPVVARRAAFELACSEAQLHVTEFGTTDMSNMAGGQIQGNYGVDGCGKRASYRAWCTQPKGMNEMCDATQTSAPTASPVTTSAATSGP